MHIHGLSRPVLGQQCLRARFHPECVERGASRISTPGQRSRRARNCVSGQRRSQDGGAAAPARKAGLKESDAAAEYVTADGDPIQATHVWRHSWSDASTPHPQLAAIEPAADGPGVCCRRRAPTQFHCAGPDQARAADGTCPADDSSRGARGPPRFLHGQALTCV